MKYLIILLTVISSCNSKGQTLVKGETKIIERKYYVKTTKYLYKGLTIYADSIKIMTSQNIEKDSTIYVVNNISNSTYINDSLEIIQFKNFLSFFIYNNKSKKNQLIKQKNEIYNNSADTSYFGLKEIKLIDFDSDNIYEVAVFWASWDLDFGIEIYKFHKTEFKSVLWTGILPISFEKQLQPYIINKNFIELNSCRNCEEGGRFEGTIYNKQIIKFDNGFVRILNN